MKLLVATRETQGQRETDFCWTEDGELLTFGRECADEEPDGACGCKRSLFGVKSRKATTTFKVEECDFSLEYILHVTCESLARAGYNRADAAALAMELIQAAGYFNGGDVIERRGDAFDVRISGAQEWPDVLM